MEQASWQYSSGPYYHVSFHYVDPEVRGLGLVMAMKGHDVSRMIKSSLYKIISIRVEEQG